MVKTLADDSPSYSTIKKWAADFKLEGRALNMTQGPAAHSVEAYQQAQDATFFQGGIEMLEWRWTKCIEVRGDYVEK